MATTTTIAATTLLLHRHIFRPIHRTTTLTFPLLHRPNLSFSFLKSQNYPFSCLPLFCSFQENKDVTLENVKEDDEEEVNTESETVINDHIPEIEVKEVPSLTVKEKKELCSYANSLGDKLKCQQVGKSGVTKNVVFAFNETLESKELLKLKIHRTCPGELVDVVKQLELATGSVVIGQIGRTVIFYRPSVTKLKAEKKKEQVRKLFAQRREKAQAAFMKRDQSPTRPGGGQYGSRRSESSGQYGSRRSDSSGQYGSRRFDSSEKISS